MTRDERVALSVRAYADADLDKDHEEAMDAALDAALADVGGLDGLTLLADQVDHFRLRELVMKAVIAWQDGEPPDDLTPLAIAMTDLTAALDEPES